MVANETKLVKQPAVSTGGESRAGARDARLSRGQPGGHEQTNWTRTAEHQQHKAEEDQAAEDIRAKWQTREIFRLKINNGGQAISDQKITTEIAAVELRPLRKFSDCWR